MARLKTRNVRLKTHIVFSSSPPLQIDAKVSLATTYAQLFPSGLTHPVRSLDLSRKGKYGYYTSAGLFVDLDLDVNALLGSCGLYDPRFHY
jgi:hypothetical protein